MHKKPRYEAAKHGVGDKYVIVTNTMHNYISQRNVVSYLDGTKHYNKTV